MFEEFVGQTVSWISSYIEAWGIVIFGTAIMMVVILMALLLFCYIYLGIKKAHAKTKLSELPTLKEETPTK